ncbi:hypothetical protein EON64_13765 [archaeon]|nr:MAG: hypothetical protein EON64_13765 [archaeon]
MDEFMEITGVTSEEEALNWLSAADFDISLAVDLFLNCNTGKVVASSHSHSSSSKRHSDSFDIPDNLLYEEDVDVRKPDPVKKQRLIESADNISKSKLPSEEHLCT